jgi:hypothetical protein
MPNIYLIRQDHSHLCRIPYGDILTDAVVIAKSIDDAKRTLVRHLESQSELVTWDTELWAIFKIGNNGRLPSQEPEHAVICTNVQPCYGLPPGNYMPRKK